MVDKLVGRLETVPVGLSKIGNVVDNDIVKLAVFVELITKVNSIDTTKIVSKIQFDSNRENFEKNTENIENKIPIIIGLTTAAGLNTKVSVIEKILVV